VDATVSVGWALPTISLKWHRLPACDRVALLSRGRSWRGNPQDSGKAADGISNGLLWGRVGVGGPFFIPFPQWGQKR